jgi:hypothetical protein
LILAQPLVQGFWKLKKIKERHVPVFFKIQNKILGGDGSLV